MNDMIAFGPVPSRRLGRSIGINNIPAKICTYSCIYCQVGKALKTVVKRGSFYKPEKIYEDIASRVRLTHESGELIDYLTFVPDGEPTLDIHLGDEIGLLKELGYKIAIITNASLLWIEDVRNAILSANWISLKIDTVSEDTWQMVNRPHASLKMDQVMDGIVGFSRIFEGALNTETMLIRGVNDSTEEIQAVAEFIGGLGTDNNYLAIPTRPPTESWVKPTNEKTMNQAFQIYSDHNLHPEYLIGYEGNAFASTGDTEADLLSITAVHPMREDAVRVLLETNKDNWKMIDRMIHRGKLIKYQYEGNNFYMRTFPGIH